MPGRIMAQMAIMPPTKTNASAGSIDLARPEAEHDEGGDGNGSGGAGVASIPPMHEVHGCGQRADHQAEEHAGGADGLGLEEVADHPGQADQRDADAGQQRQQEPPVDLPEFVHAWPGGGPEQATERPGSLADLGHQRGVDAEHERHRPARDARDDVGGTHAEAPPDLDGGAGRCVRSRHDGTGGRPGGPNTTLTAGSGWGSVGARDHRPADVLRGRRRGGHRPGRALRDRRAARFAESTWRVFVNAPPSLREWWATARGRPDDVGLVYEDERWTYGEAMAAIDGLAHALVHDFGVAKGDRVAIGMRNYPEWICAIAAITSVGAISVSLNAWWTEDEMDFALRDSGSTVLVADIERAERAAADRGRDGSADHRRPGRRPRPARRRRPLR